MKKIVMLILLLAGMARADWEDFAVNQVIPDNDETGFQDTQTLSGYGNLLQSLEVRLRFSSAPADFAYNGDYYVTLQHDSGFAVLLNRVGRTAGNSLGYDNTGFDLTFTLAGNDVHLYQNYAPSYDGEGRLTGNWGVDGRNVDPSAVLDTDAQTATLSSFTGVNPNGNWTIFVADVNLNGRATFDSWGLNVTTIPEPATWGLLALGGMLLLRRRFLWTRR